MSIKNNYRTEPVGLTCSGKKGVLKKFVKITERHLQWYHLFSKVARLASFLKQLFHRTPVVA